MTAYDDLLDAGGGVRRVFATFDPSNGIFAADDSGLAADVTVDQQVDDLSDALTNIAGTAAAQATITFKGANGAASHLDLSPFSTNADSMRTQPLYGLGRAVRITYHGYGTSGSQVGSSFLFQGFIDGFSLGEDASTVSCLDSASALQGTVNLPAAAGSVANFSSGDSRLNPLAVVDLAMRSCGKYITPPHRTAGGFGSSPDSVCVVSAPGVGGYLPEVGSFMAHGSTWANLATPTIWAAVPTVDVCAAGSFKMSRNFVVWGEWAQRRLLVEGWFYLTRPPSGQTWFLSFGSENPSTALGIGVNSSGNLVIRQGTGAVDSTTTTVFVPSGSNWVYLAFDPEYVTVYDGTHEEGKVPSFVPDTLLDGKSQISVATYTLGLQAWVEPAWAATVSAYVGSGPSVWTPNYSAALSSVSARLAGLSRQSAPAWSTVQQVAKAYGDVAWWDGAGAFHYETRATWKARRLGATSRTLTDTNAVISGLPAWSRQSVCRSVSAAVVTPQVAQSTTTAPAWQATEVYNVPARTKLTFQIDLDYQLYDIKAASNNWSTDANSSWFRAVRDTSVGDPAAVLTSNVAMGFRGNATGLQLIIVNNNPFPIATWSPGDGGSIPAGPYLVVHGKTIRWPDPKSLTRQAGLSGQDLAMEDNPWRQDPDFTRAWLDDVAQEVAYPQVIWPTITIPFDPRITIGSVISVLDSRHMDVAHPVQVVGVSADLPAEGMHTMGLTVRGAYAPTGLIVGVSALVVATNTMKVQV